MSVLYLDICLEEANLIHEIKFNYTKQVSFFGLTKTSSAYKLSKFSIDFWDFSMIRPEPAVFINFSLFA